MSHLRPIERGSFAEVVPPETFGPAPQLQWIAIHRLVVDDGYQRPIESQGARRNVRAIAAGFDWRRFAPVIVSPITGGRFAVVDGQHRTTAALLVGIAEVPCLVILADGPEQARAFEAINGQVTQIKPAQIFKARLAHGDPAAKRIAAVAAAAGVNILTTKPSWKDVQPGDTMALLTITRMVELHGDKTVRITLMLIRVNAGDRRGYLRTSTIQAMATVLADNPTWRDDPRLPRALDGTDLDETWREAGLRAASIRNGKLIDQLQAMLITHFDAVLSRGDA